VVGISFQNVMTDRHINVCNSIIYQASIHGGFLSSRMGGLISGKVNRATYPTKDDRFSSHLNVERLAENVNESKDSTRYAGVWADVTLQRLTLNKQKGLVYSIVEQHKCC
jgi:hypothetical protein